MGRWRNGVPLVLSPHTDKPEPAVARDKLNEFDYVSPTHTPRSTTTATAGAARSGRTCGA